MPVPTQKASLERVSAKEKIYRTLRDWIIEGVLEPDEKVSDAELSKYFSVSRTPVREALQLLEVQKLIRVQPGKATVVAPIAYENLEEWYMPLAYLQGLGAELACRHMTGEQLDELERLNAAFAAAISSGEVAAILRADGAFHSRIMEAAGNHYLIEFSETLLLHIQRIEYAYFKGATESGQSVRSHELLIDAFRKGDAEAAGAEMKNNWLRTMTHYAGKLQEPKTVPSGA